LKKKVLSELFKTQPKKVWLKSGSNELSEIFADLYSNRWIQTTEVGILQNFRTGKSTPNKTKKN